MADMKPIDTDEVIKRKNAKRQTIAMMGHQDMTPSPELLADMDLHAAGLLTDKEFLRRCDERVANRLEARHAHIAQS